MQANDAAATLQRRSLRRHESLWRHGSPCYAALPTWTLAWILLGVLVTPLLGQTSPQTPQAQPAHSATADARATAPEAPLEVPHLRGPCTIDGNAAEWGRHPAACGQPATLRRGKACG